MVRVRAYGLELELGLSTVMTRHLLQCINTHINIRPL